MKKIGQGLQFNVYEKGKKVIKIPTSKFQIKLKLILWMPWLLFRLSKLEKEARKVIKERIATIKEVRKKKIKSFLLANVNIKKNWIEQDRVKPLGKYLKNSDNWKEIIDNYINFIFEGWKYGFSEKTYNFTTNNGVDEKDRIVLTDIGELSFKKYDVEKAINTKRWEKSWTFKWDLPKRIKEYYDEQMIRNLTLSNLNKYWK